MELVAERARFVAVELQHTVREHREVFTHLFARRIHKNKHLGDGRRHQTQQAHESGRRDVPGTARIAHKAHRIGTRLNSGQYIVFQREPAQFNADTVRIICGSI